MLHLTERNQTFSFSGISSRPVLSINRSFSAPVNLHFEQNAADLVQIARHETDMFARFQALTDLALPALIAATKAVQNGGEVRTDAELIATLIEIVGDPRSSLLSAHRRWRCPAKRILPVNWVAIPIRTPFTRRATPP